MSRPKKEPGSPVADPAAKDRQTVEMLAACGITEADIAAVMQISMPTLRLHYQHELRTGHVRANARVARSLFEKAVGDGQGSVAAAIFWLKTRCGWVEPKPGDEPGKKETIRREAQSATVGSDWSADLDWRDDGRPN